MRGVGCERCEKCEQCKGCERCGRANFIIALYKVTDVLSDNIMTVCLQNYTKLG